MSDHEEVRFLRILPWWGIGANKYMVRNFSKTLGNIAKSIANPITAQEKYLNSLFQVVLDN